MALREQFIEYEHDGVVFEGFLVRDDSFEGQRPAVAVAHAWAGRDDFELERARDLAGLGYVGFALDVYGKGKLGTSAEENTALMQPLLGDRQLLLARLRAGLATLRAQPGVDPSQVAAIGYCFGGLAVLDMARANLEVRGVVSFHGLFTPPPGAAATNIAPKILCLHGYDDPMAQPQTVLDLATELSGAGADWQVHAYGGTLHAFTNPHANDRDFGTVYDPRAARRAWQAMSNFLEELFTG